MYPESSAFISLQGEQFYSLVLPLPMGSAVKLNQRVVRPATPCSALPSAPSTSIAEVMKPGMWRSPVIWASHLDGPWTSLRLLLLLPDFPPACLPAWLTDCSGAPLTCFLCSPSRLAWCSSTPQSIRPAAGPHSLTLTGSSPLCITTSHTCYLSIQIASLFACVR